MALMNHQVSRSIDSDDSNESDGIFEFGYEQLTTDLKETGDFMKSFTSNFNKIESQHFS